MERQMDGLLLKYFVLKPGGTSTHAEASRAAMLSYAAVVERDNPTFARELREWVRREEPKGQKS